jgi:hypothetical protein
MKFRRIALALALICGFTALGEAKRKPSGMHFKGRSAKVSNKRVKPRKVVKRKVVRHR